MSALWLAIAVWSVGAEAWGAEPTVSLVLGTAGNHISFDRARIEVPLQERITIFFDNQADLDSHIAHNVVILKPGTTEAVFAKLRELQYDLEKFRGDPNILAMTPPLAPGEGATVSFEPQPATTYPYVCLMPGHGDVLGMKGELHVGTTKTE